MTERTILIKLFNSVEMAFALGAIKPTEWPNLTAEMSSVLTEACEILFTMSSDDANDYVNGIVKPIEPEPLLTLHQFKPEG